MTPSQLIQCEQNIQYHFTYAEVQILSFSFTPRDSDKGEVKIFPLKPLFNMGILLPDSRPQMVAGTP